MVDVLLDYDDTKQRMLALIQEKGRTSDEIMELIRRPTEDEDDVVAVRKELLAEKKIYWMFGEWKPVTEESLRNKDVAKARKRKGPPNKKANPWAWYAWLPDNNEYRERIRRSFTKEDGEVFRFLAAIILGDSKPQVGERISGPMTEEEGRYISRINQQLDAYIKERNSNG